MATERDTVQSLRQQLRRAELRSVIVASQRNAVIGGLGRQADVADARPDFEAETIAEFDRMVDVQLDEMATEADLGPRTELERARAVLGELLDADVRSDNTDGTVTVVVDSDTWALVEDRSWGEEPEFGPVDESVTEFGAVAFWYDEDGSVVAGELFGGATLEDPVTFGLCVTGPSANEAAVALLEAREADAAAA